MPPLLNGRPYPLTKKEDELLLLRTESQLITKRIPTHLIALRANLDREDIRSVICYAAENQ